MFHLRKFASFAALLALCLTSLPAFSAEDDDESFEDKMKSIVALGPGVHKVQKDKKGRITSCVIVGQSRISTALGAAKGKQVARDKASLAASGEFVKWLNEEVSVHQSSEEETVTLLEGTEGVDGDTLKESGKAVEKSSTKMESVSKGLVRGLIILHKDVDGDEKTYTVVKGWKADTADAAKDLAESDGGSGKSKKKTDKPKINKDIESDSATSEDAKDFFKK